MHGSPATWLPGHFVPTHLGNFLITRMHMLHVNVLMQFWNLCHSNLRPSCALLHQSYGTKRKTFLAILPLRNDHVFHNKFMDEWKIPQRKSLLMQIETETFPCTLFHGFHLLQLFHCYVWNFLISTKLKRVHWFFIMQNINKKFWTDRRLDLCMSSDAPKCARLINNANREIFSGIIKIRLL